MKLKLHKFQQKAFFSPKKVVVSSAGIQSGKSLCGAAKLGYIINNSPPDWNFIICAPTYKIMTAATIPTFMKIYGKWGKLNKAESYFKFWSGHTVWIRSLTDPNAMEGITNVGGIWLDEGGMISKYAWENVRGRAAFRDAPIFVTTTPYALNWLFSLYKEWKAGQVDWCDFIIFRSIDNPYFPKEVYEREKRSMDPRRFAMKYDGVFGQMEGLVYEDIETCKSFALPAGTRYFAGVDWGYNDPFVITVRAVTPEGIHYRVAEFYKRHLTMSEIVDICRARKQLYNIETFVCDPSRPDSIMELNKAGCSSVPGKNDIRLGIDKQIELMRTQKFFIFEDENPFGLDEYAMYHYPEPKELGVDDDSKDRNPVDAHNHGCFRAGTKIKTAQGEKPIEEIEIGDLVWTPMGLKPVTKCGITGIRTLIRVHFSNGASFDCTEEHPVYQYRKYFTEIQTDSIVSTWNGNTSHFKAKSIAGMVAITHLLAVVLKAGIGFTERFGDITREIFQKVSTSTILMAILKTTKLKISCAYLMRIIKLYTRKIRYPEVRQKKCCNTSIGLERKQKFGILAQKGLSGIESMAKKPWQIAKRCLKLAFSAAKNLEPLALKPNTARTIVSLLQDAEVAWTILKLHVLSVIRLLLKTNMTRSRPVTISAVESLSSEIAPVYNLTVESGCYYANNILVSNCDADRYVTMFIEGSKLGTTGQVRRLYNPNDNSPPDNMLERIEWLKQGGTSKYNPDK